MSHAPIDFRYTDRNWTNMTRTLHPLLASSSRGALIGMALSALIGVTGCGGSGGRAPSALRGGRALFSVHWPAPTRLIPGAAKMLAVTVYDNGVPVAHQTVSRPTNGATTSQVTLTGLPYDVLTVGVKAYPKDAESGTPQATGVAEMTVSEDQPGTASVALASTATQISIGKPTKTWVGDASSVTLSATDKDGNIVLLSSGAGSEPIEWSVGDSTVATITGTGPTATLTGIGKGDTQIHARMIVDDKGTKIGDDAGVEVDQPLFTLTADASCTYGTQSGSLQGVAPTRAVWVSFVANLSPAPTSAISFDLSSDLPISSISGSPITFGANQASATARLYPEHVDVETSGTVTLTHGALTATSQKITLKPNPLSSISGPGTVGSGASATARVTLGLYALAAENVTLSCDDSRVVLPAQVTVAAPVRRGTGFPPAYNNSNSVTFTFTAPTVTALSDPITITATRAGATQKFSFTVTP